METKGKISFSVVSDGISRIKDDVVIIKAEKLSDNCSLKDVYSEARKCALEKIDTKTAHLVAEKISAEDMEAMDLRWIIFMHDPVKSNGHMSECCLLEVVRGNNCCHLGLCSDIPVFSKYSSSYGFAFAVSNE